MPTPPESQRGRTGHYPEDFPANAEGPGDG